MKISINSPSSPKQKEALQNRINRLYGYLIVEAINKMELTSQDRIKLYEAIKEEVKRYKSF